jgi:8-oxo-dGTP pyrophosphatase MutT (NUDIX family)
MPHIHRLYDFVVSVFIVHRNRVLLIDHKKYNEWLPIGGHIELDEDPETSLFREIREECGLPVRILAGKPAIGHAGVKPILTPSFVDVHRITGIHKHIAFIYFAVAKHDKVRLHEREHREYRWIAEKELCSKELKLTRSILFYSCAALNAAKGGPKFGR